MSHPATGALAAATSALPHGLLAAAAHSPHHYDKLTHAQAALLAILQGVAELFPVSSIGHTVIVPKLLKWNIDQSATSFLAFVVALHLGTAIALLVYFWRDWVEIVTPMVRSVSRGQLGNTPQERIGWLVVVGTAPAAILGVLFEKSVRNALGDARVAASFLIVNGFLLYFGERLRVRAVAALATARGGSQSVPLAGAPRPIEALGWTEALVIGALQALAFFPGISRSGVTIVAGLASGFSHEAAARFAFLLATPVIAGAAVLELPTLFGSDGRPLLGDALVGCVLAGIGAYASVRFLMRYFTSGKLGPFAIYCWIAGALSLIVVSIRG
ncbi:MAG TPA: undecaprenyl-diphosphate phosphatase [Chloroflexota bacterium]